MTNVAISGLPAAGPLAGPELIPVVQSGVTSKSTISAVSSLLLGTYIDARNYNIDPTGTNDSSVGGNQAISDAINQKKVLIWPSGLFKLNAPLLAFTGGQQSFQMYGQGGAAYPSDNGLPQNPVGHPYDANTIFYTNYTNAPAIVVNNGRFLVLKDFAILGQNLAPATGSTLSTGPSVSQSQYITSGCQNGRFAPYCGIAFDPFSNSTSQSITGITQATNAAVTVSTGGSTNPFIVSQQIVFSSVGGMTQINGLAGTVSAIGGSSGAWTATVNINSSGFSAYTSGGAAVGLPYNFGAISGIAAGSTTVVTLSTGGAVNPFQYGETVTFSGVVGMTQINGLTGSVIATGVTNTGAWTFTVNINSTGFSTYSSGGQAVASDAYTSLASNYQSSYAGEGTYGCVVENLHISSFVVGVAIGLSGNEALAADLTFRNVNVQYCDVCYAIGQSQSRNLNIQFGNINNARTGVDALNYGHLNGTPAHMTRANWGNLYRLFALGQSVGNCVLENCYAESNICFGEYGLGGASAATPLTFIGGDYTFGGNGWLQAPILLETYGPTTFTGTSIGYAVEIDALNFIMPTQPIQFSHCLFSGTSIANVLPQIAITTDSNGAGYAKFLDCWIDSRQFGSNGTNCLISNDLGRAFGAAKFTTATGRLPAIYQTYRVSNGNSASDGEYIFLPYSQYPSIIITGVSSLAVAGTTVTFSCSNAAQLMQGDILFWQLIQQGTSLIKWSVPALKITNISGTAVTCTMLFDSAQYDTAANQQSNSQVWLAPNHWAPTQGLTCSTTNTSKTLSGVSPTTILQNGDFVAGTNIPANTRVVSGGGTATVTISQAATATASGVELWFGRLYALSLNPLT